MTFTKHLQYMVKQDVMFLHFFVSASYFAAFVGEVSIYLSTFCFEPPRTQASQQMLLKLFLFVHH